MFPDKGIFGWGSNFNDRFIADYGDLAKLVAHVREKGYKIVLTQGSFDIIHIGHALYLEKARQHGDLLIVGVDSDDKIRQAKGPNRPVVPQEERLQMLTHLRSVTVVTLKEMTHPKWHLIKTVRPDKLIVSERTSYTKTQIAELKKQYCGDVVSLESQWRGSTTGRIRHLEVSGGQRIAERIQAEIPELVAAALRDLRDGQ